MADCHFPFAEIGRQLQKELLKYGLAAFASKVVADTVPYTTFLTDVHNYNGVGKALEPISKRSKIYGEPVDLTAAQFNLLNHATLKPLLFKKKKVRASNSGDETHFRLNSRRGTLRMLCQLRPAFIGNQPMDEFAKAGEF